MSRKMIYLDDAIDAMACVSDSICGQQAIDALCELPSAQPYTDEEIQTMQDVEQAQFEKVYQLGYEEGKKDAEPERKKGKWIQGDQDKLLGRASCSVCNKWEYQASNFNFCPNCGADMRGEDDV